MPVHEVSEALAVEYCSRRINTDALIQKDDMQEMSCGLVIIDEQEIVSFAHATMHECLSSRLNDIHCFGLIITKTCLLYLNFDTLNLETITFVLFFSPLIDRLIDNHQYKKYHYRVKLHPFLPYAARNWSDHFLRSPISEELTSLCQMVRNGPNTAAMLQAYSEDMLEDVKVSNTTSSSKNPASPGIPIIC